MQYQYQITEFQINALTSGSNFLENLNWQICKRNDITVKIKALMQSSTVPVEKLSRSIIISFLTGNILARIAPIKEGRGICREN